MGELRQDSAGLSKACSDGEVLYRNGEFDAASSARAFFQRTRESFLKTSPHLHKAIHHTSSEIILWMQKGSPWRAFLVSTVGIVLLLGLAGLGTFMLFFLAATTNAVAIGFLASVASVGAFATLFFTSLTAIYVGALVIAVVTISAITFFCICAVLAAAGSIAFLWVTWEALKKGIDLVRGFLPSRISSFAPKDYEQQCEKMY